MNPGHKKFVYQLIKCRTVFLLSSIFCFSHVLAAQEKKSEQDKSPKPNVTEKSIDLIPSDLDESDQSESSGIESDKTENNQKRPTRSLLEFNDSSGRLYTLDMMAAADFLGQWDNDEPHTTNNRLDVREVELGFLGDIDQIADGTISAAAHFENGEQVLELHEAYFHFPDIYVPNMSARLGKMFFDVGRLNTIHRHDWLFSVAPKVHEELLDEEGVADTGAELDWLIPWPWDRFVQNLTIGVYNGRTFGHSHNEGSSKNNPLYTAHLKQFVRITNEWGTQFGFSYLRYHPTTEANKIMHQSGLDWIVKWKRDDQMSFQFLTEVWYRETREKNSRDYDEPVDPVETRVGAYSLFEFQFHKQWSIGYRYDIFTNPNYVNEQGIKHETNGHEGNMIQITWRPSEFSNFRASGQRSTILETGKNTYQFYLQGTFILGKHPAHIY